MTDEEIAFEESPKIQRAIAKFLEDHGADLLQWSHGTVMIESYFEKQFVAMGGGIDRLIACFEDNGNIEDAITEYMRHE